MQPVASTGATAGAGAMTFLVADPEQALTGVRLVTDAPVNRRDFSRTGTGWRLVLDVPPLTRIEYLLEFRYRAGGSKLLPDPANPDQVDGAFGPKSVLELPDYAAPRWLSADVDPGVSGSIEVPAMDAAISARIWSPSSAAADEPLPLLVVHDGPEYDSLASLTRFLGAGVAGGWLPRLRAALLSPGARNSWYSANPRYASALRRLMLPALGATVRTTRQIGMGTSLGALGMLHAHCLRPFDALFLQSGSFFVPRLDSQERRFPHYRRITAFTAEMHAGRVTGTPVPAVLTCGGLEENIGNNRLMTRTLQAGGYQASLHEVRDLHNYTAWRDAFDPHLSELLRRVER